jgi:porin
VPGGHPQSVQSVSWILITGIVMAGTTAVQAQDATDANGASSKSAATVTVVYDGDGFSGVAGGVRRGEVYLGTLNVELSLDGTRLFGWPGMSAYVGAVWIHGGQPDAFTDDAQGVSNLTGPSAVRVEEAWMQVSVFANRFSVLAGRYDLNTEFYRTQSAGLFVNSSFGVGPEFSQSGQAGPSIFPSTAIGARLAFKPTPNGVVRTAVFDGAPVDRPGGVAAVFKRGDGVLLLGEAAFLKRPTSAEQPPPRIRFRIGRASGLPPYEAKVAVGGWYYTATFPDLSEAAGNGKPMAHSGSGGLYAVADRVLARARGDDHRQLSAFAEAGLGDQRVNRFRAYVGTGLVATGLLSSRPSDELGLALAWARNGSHFMQMQEQSGMPTNRAETAIELTYLSQIATRFALQPDVQYIVHPGTMPSVKNACALQLRFEVRF